MTLIELGVTGLAAGGIGYGISKTPPVKRWRMARARHRFHRLQQDPFGTINRRQLRRQGRALKKLHRLAGTPRRERRAIIERFTRKGFTENLP